MSADNNCNFVGRLTREPELKYTNGGTAVCIIDLAVFTYYDKKNQKEKVCFPRFKKYGKAAENLAKNLEKGQLVSIQAEFRLDRGDNKYYPWFQVIDIRFKSKPNKKS